MLVRVPRGKGHVQGLVSEMLHTHAQKNSSKVPLLQWFFLDAIILFHPMLMCFYVDEETNYLIDIFLFVSALLSTATLIFISFLIHTLSQSLLPSLYPSHYFLFVFLFLSLSLPLSLFISLSLSLNLNLLNLWLHFSNSERLSDFWKPWQ